MTEIRCVKCKRLLFKGEWNGKIEIKCPKCGFIDAIQVTDGKVEVRVDVALVNAAKGDLIGFELDMAKLPII